MKTLDEVIQGIEDCQNMLVDCRHGCPMLREGMPDCDKDDLALHYLKEYQKEILNNQLTFDEIRYMPGCPVWMEFDDVKGGMLVNHFDSTFDDTKGIALTDRYGTDYVFSEESVNKDDVKVYRKEPK